MDDRLLCIHADRMAARKLANTKERLNMEFAKDDAFLTKDRKLAEMQQDPMVHRGIGDAVKEPLQDNFAIALGHCKKLLDHFDSASLRTPAMAHLLSQHKAQRDEAKRKARSDRMKATWAKQRAEAQNQEWYAENRRLGLYESAEAKQRGEV